MALRTLRALVPDDFCRIVAVLYAVFLAAFLVVGAFFPAALAGALVMAPLIVLLAWMGSRRP